MLFLRSCLRCRLRLTSEHYYRHGCESLTLSFVVCRLLGLNLPRVYSTSLEIGKQTKTKRSPREKSTKKAIKTKTSKTKTKTLPSADESTKKSQDKSTPPRFPFEGEPTEPSSHSASKGSLSHSHIERVDVNGNRHYLIKHSQESYCFPSVTSVLEATMPSSMYFRLYHWEKNMVKEHGQTKSNNIVKGILQSGANFHKEMEQMLLKSTTEDVISIKPWINDTKPEHTTEKIQDQRPSICQPLHNIQSVSTTPLAASATKAPIGLDDTIDDVLEDITKPGIVSDVKGEVISFCQQSVEIDFGSAAVDEKVSGYKKSVEDVLKDISNVCAIESVVTHLELGYTGTFDCLAEYRGKLCVIDWKTSSKPKPTLSHCYTFPLQAAAYAGAINQDHHYPYKVTNALIVIVYPNGDPAHAHFLSHDQLLTYWGEWLQRLDQYQTQFARDLSQLVV